MKELKWQINLLIKITLIFILNCSAILKPNIYSNLEIVDSLERDSFFYISDNEFLKDNNADLFEDNMKKYKALKNENEINLYAIYSAKNSHIEESEKSFLFLIDNYEKDIYLLNYIRLKYLTEEFDSLREYLKIYIKKNINNKLILQNISARLKENSRFEENTIYMGVISDFPIYEKEASNELGEYFISIGDYSNAKVFYEKILNSYSYDIKALDYLLLISNSEENWQNRVLNHR
jgi:tetratricopeptide (TPR) repeat protein